MNNHTENTTLKLYGQCVPRRKTDVTCSYSYW